MAKIDTVPKIIKEEYYIEDIQPICPFVVTQNVAIKHGYFCQSEFWMLIGCVRSTAASFCNRLQLRNYYNYSSEDF